MRMLTAMKRTEKEMPIAKRGRSGLRKWLHRGFRIGILLKGLDGLLEIAGGVLLVFLSPRRLNEIVRLVTQHELAERHPGFWGDLMHRAAVHFTPGLQKFGVWYLLAHGIVKIGLVVLLLRGKRWAYPAAMIFLAVFMAYQIVRFALAPAVWLVVLTVFDGAVLLLTFFEYRRLKRENASP